MEATPSLRWGLVGTSGYAERVCVPAIAQTSTAQLVAVASSSQERAASFAARTDIARGYGDTDALFDDPEVQAVWIASSSFLHFDHAARAIAQGKHVLLEKPIALTAAQGWQLVKLAQESGVKLATGYQARYVPGHIRMRELIAAGAIGRVVTARSLYGMRRESAPQSWRGSKETARWGVLADIGTHHLDLLRMLLGEVEFASGFTAAQRGYDTEDLAVAALRFSGDVLATLTATASYYRPTTVVEVIGTDAALVATDTSPTGQGQVLMHRANGAVDDITGDTPHSAQAQLATVTAAFCGEDVDYATGEDGARNLDVLEQIAPD
jgi:1,5-anhydro-D-fructose reductase (1,5-anhydro-D-mannitol-forming)